MESFSNHYSTDNSQVYTNQNSCKYIAKKDFKDYSDKIIASENKKIEEMSKNDDV